MGHPKAWWPEDSRAASKPAADDNTPRVYLSRTCTESCRGTSLRPVKMAMTTTDHPLTSINPALFPVTEGGRQEFAGATPGETQVAGTIAKAISEMISEKSGLTDRSMVMHGGVPVHQGPPHTTTSLTHVIEGTAEVIQRNIAMSFAKRPDPIKSFMAQKILKSKSMIVNTPKVTGGVATLTPERALARVVSTAAESRTFETARYGLDIIMNTNMFQQPIVAAEELRVKLAAQRLQMDEAWIGLTYQTVLDEGVSLVAAALRANPVKGVKQGRARRIEASNMHANLFATFDKDDYAIPNIFAALSWAGVYTPVGGAPSGGVLLVPPGTNLIQYTDPSHMNFFMSGIAQGNESIPFPLDNVRTDSMYGVKILTHFPPADYTNYDSENPQVTNNELMRPVAISNYYPIDSHTWEWSGDAREGRPGPGPVNGIMTSMADARVAGPGGEWNLGMTNFETRDWTFHRFDALDLQESLRVAARNLVAFGYDNRKSAIGSEKLCPQMMVTGLRALMASFGRGDGELPRYQFRTPHEFDDRPYRITPFLWRPHHVLMMNSAIYCARPGEETGYMLMGYPKSSVAISQTTDHLIVTLRMYLGAGVVNPQNIIILHDVQAAGNIKGHGCRLQKDPSRYTPQSDEDEEGGDDLVFMAKLESTPWTDLLNDPIFVLLNLRGPMSEIIRQKVEYDGGAADEFPDFADVTGREGGMPPMDPDRPRSLELPIIPYCGTVINGAMVKVHRNNGHLEGLDDPEYVDRIEGRQKCHSRTFVAGGR